MFGAYFPVLKMEAAGSFETVIIYDTDCNLQGHCYGNFKSHDPLKDIWK
jgi:hypothetical protein